MKKLLFTLTLLAAVSFLSAQNLQFIYEGVVCEEGQTIVGVYSEDFGDYSCELFIRNLTDHEMTITIQRELVNLPEGASSYFCFGDQCGGPLLDIMSSTVPAQTDDLFAAHCTLPEGGGSATVKFYAYDEHDPDNKISIVFIAGQNTDVTENVIRLGQAYPNPASSQVHFDLKSSSNSNINVVVYNLLGQEVKSQLVSGRQGRISISVDDLQAGIYFCNFQINNAVVKTEKFIVKK